MSGSDTTGPGGHLGGVTVDVTGDRAGPMRLPFTVTGARRGPPWCVLAGAYLGGAQKEVRLPPCASNCSVSCR
ncbi:hypothetical protein GCM10027290_67350 [Micromonospora sonneratiae]